MNQKESKDKEHPRLFKGHVDLEALKNFKSKRCDFFEAQ